ncbi:MAG TPA: heavy metal translocating P-type ATPase, partial [Saprospiraceae bacterium]|nr:heavy metal translocating P-type ATPase [Saprospiraceae bacterium]
MAQECCHDEQPGEAAPRSPVHDHDHDHDHDHEHGHGDDWKQWLAPVVSAVVLAAGLWLDHTAFSWFGRPFLRSGWYVLAYLPVAWPVWVQAVRSMRGGTVFSEFFLMGIATAGAFYLGQYAEGVA